jgi:hypothetical protein
MMRRPREPTAAMKFGYFTLSDNRYPNNPRSAEQFLVEIRDQAVFAEKLGLNSAWIGERHFNGRGCVSVPAVVLANVAAATTRLRLGPAVVVLPIHHPIHVAEEWAHLTNCPAAASISRQGAATTVTSSRRSMLISILPLSSSAKASNC